MTTRTYLQIPINADEGFPQAFQLVHEGQAYTFSFYATLLAEAAEALPAGPPEETVYDLPQPSAYLVMRVERQSPGGAEVIFQRKLVPGLEYEAGEVAFLFKTIRIARANLNGVGAFDSTVIGGIASR